MISQKKKVSPDEILNFIGFGPFQVIAFLLSGFTYFSYGCDISIFVFVGKSVSKQWNITTTEFAILPAATGIPNILGAFFFSILSDRFGRLWPYALCVGWVGLFSVASAFSNSFILLIVLRCLASFAIGGIVGFVNPTVIEFLPIRNRGTVTVLNMLMGSLGLCFSCGLAWWLIPTYPDQGWRYYVAASAVPIILMVIFRLSFHFESPRHLIAKGKLKKAWTIFESIAKINGKRLSDFASSTTCSICISKSTLDVKKETNKSSIFIQVLNIFHPNYLRRTLPMTVIIVTQTAGYLSSQLFLPNFLERVGVSTYFTLMVTSVAQLPGIILLSIIVEWPEFGRLNSLRFFSTLSAIFFILLTFIQNSITIPVFLVFIYFSTAPILGLNYTYISEAYPTSIRSITTAYFFMFQALTYIAGALLTSKAVDMPQPWLFPAVFAGCYLIQFLMALVLNYEPMGKKLQDTI